MRHILLPCIAFWLLVWIRSLRAGDVPGSRHGLVMAYLTLIVWMILSK